jgi:hypothetical protein
MKVMAAGGPRPLTLRAAFPLGPGLPSGHLDVLDAQRQLFSAKIASPRPRATS